MMDEQLHVLLTGVCVCVCVYVCVCVCVCDFLGDLSEGSAPLTLAPSAAASSLLIECAALKKMFTRTLSDALMH